MKWTNEEKIGTSIATGALVQSEIKQLYAPPVLRYSLIGGSSIETGTAMLRRG